MLCFGTGLYLAESSTAFISIIELKSIVENMDYINGTDIFTTMFKRIRNAISGRIEDKIDKPR
jgi:hypothetical protein